MKIIPRSITRSPRFARALLLSSWAAFLSLALSLRADPDSLVYGALRREVFYNVPGPGLSDLTGNPKFPAHPDLVTSVSSFETPSNSGDNYGERLSGFLLPPVTGDYVFYLASDDQGALLLSRDSEPTNMVQIAWEPTWSWPRSWTSIGAGRTNQANISAPTYLEAGRRYYVQAVHKEGGGGDNFGVAWQIPGEPPPQDGSPPISGQYLAMLGDGGSNFPPHVTIVTPPEGAVFSPGGNIQLGANATDADDDVAGLWFFSGTNCLGRAGGPFLTPAGAYLLTWSNVPPGSYTLTAQATDIHGLSGTSAPVQITVHINGTADSFVRRIITGNLIRLVAEPTANVSAYAVEDQLPQFWGATNLSDDGAFDPITGKVKFGPFFDAQPRTVSYQVLPPLGFLGAGYFSGTASEDGVNSPIIGDDCMVIKLPHPADRAPADWALRMDEVTAYAAAWRTGGVWQVPPTPVPIDYMTRAVALWRGGENYTLDPSIGGPPMWWVNSPVALPVPLRVHAGASALRNVSRAYVPGEFLEVAVTVSVPSETLGYALEEALPAGWQATSLTPTGQVDSVNGQLKWGPFTDSMSRTFAYRLRPPFAAGENVRFSGSVSYDGRTEPVTGPSEVVAGSRLSCTARADGRWILQLKGPTGTYVIESSPDLEQWAPMATVTNTQGFLDIPESANSHFDGTFYRARRIPNP